MLSKKKKWLIISAICAVLLVLACVVIWCALEQQIAYNINDTLPDGGGQSARVVLLGGQSNASGCSSVEYLGRNVSEEKFSEYQNGYDNVYINYLSGARLSEGFVKCAAGQGEPDGSFGPELGLAEALSEAYPDETIFIIKCAWGGTNLYDQWLSPSSDGKTGDLYKSFVAFVNQSLEYLTSKNYDVKIEGMCWMQGESDSFSVEDSMNYEQNLECLIGDLRKEFAPYSNEDGFAFIDTYIAENPVFWVYYENVNEGKSRVAKKSSLNTVVRTSDLTCTAEPEEQPDVAHYDSMSEIEIGHRFARALQGYFDE